MFVREGRIADVFGPGHYRLETRNLPILSTLAGWKHGFESPFKAEVYFASTRQITELKWGTPNPVLMRDPDFGSVRLRAFGTYTLKAADPKTLLRELVGADAHFEAEEISELLRSIISTAFADVVANIRHRAARSRRELPGALRRDSAAWFSTVIDDEYGLDLPQLYIVNISVPAEVEQALDVRSSMSVIGDMAAFQGYQLASIHADRGREPGRGPRGRGSRARHGHGDGGRDATGRRRVRRRVRRLRPQDQTPPPVPVPAPAAWHVAENGRSSGPFSIGADLGLDRERPNRPRDYVVVGGDAGVDRRGADAAVRGDVPARTAELDAQPAPAGAPGTGPGSTGQTGEADVPFAAAGRRLQPRRPRRTLRPARPLP